ncbi:hypothetical protein J4455_04190 [Candidatus Woesearchaeota archaeon]|nr:hypothetical protein [Candidatus Woesearchaeota archaeon]
MTKESVIFRDKYLVIIFLFSTIFFLFQHYISFSWDFSSFVLNGKYLFDNGKYKININPCFIMFENISLLEKSCNLINHGNFILDSNRNLHNFYIYL